MRPGNRNAMNNTFSFKSAAGLLFIQFVIFTLFFAPAFGSCKIAGKVVDAKTGEPIIGASVYLEGTKIGAATDLDGNFFVKKADEGTYTLIVSSVGYNTVNIADVKINNDQTITLNLALEPKSIQGKKIVVTAEALKNTEAHLLIERQKAASISDAISAEAMSRSGSGNAAEAMSRVTGASVRDGKYVYIRGLGGRYSNATLDGASIPNANPDDQSVQMNLFAANLLDNVVIEKTFTPDKPGDFSGGSVELHTKDLPEEKTLTFSTSTVYNSNATGNENFLTSPRSNLEWLGFDNGFRAMPVQLTKPGGPNRNTPRKGTLEQGLSADQFHKSFNSSFDQRNLRAPWNNGGAVSFGNTYLINDHPLGILASLTYKHSYSFYDDGAVARYDLTQPDAPTLEKEYVIPDIKASEKVQWGGLAALSYPINNNHKLTTRFVYNREGEQTDRYLYGTLYGSTIGNFQSRVIEYIEQYVSSFQLNGEHYIKPLKMDWRLSYSKSHRNEPDSRYFNNSFYMNPIIDSNTGDTLGYDTTYTLATSGSNYFPEHCFREIDVKKREMQFDFSLPLAKRYEKTVKLSFGGSYVGTDRENTERVFNINYTDPVFDGNPDDFVSNENIGIDWNKTKMNEKANIDSLLAYDSTFIVKTKDTAYDGQGNIIGIFNIPPFYDTIVAIDTLKWDTLSIDTSYTFIYKRKIEESLNTAANNNFKGNQDIWAGYLMVEMPILDRLKLVGGARYETTDMEVIGTISDSVQGSIHASDILPSVSFTYALTDQMNLRLAYGRTLARPTFKEKSRLITYEFGQRGLIFHGNPDLTYTKINNYDFRWEWFNGPGKIIAASFFYKKFKNPIERAYFGPNNDVMYINVENARVYGVELEFRQGLGMFSRYLSNFKFESNFTFANSRIDIPESEMANRLFYDSSASSTRQLEGQPPYIINLGLTYENIRSRTVASMMFNIFGKRLAFVGRMGIPDVYEKPRPMLDLTISQKVLGGINLKLNASNLLDAKVSQIITYKNTDYVFREYSVGRSISIGASYKL